MPRSRRWPILAALLAAASLGAQALDVGGLDKGVGACTDFYAYANRKWVESVEIPADRDSWSTAAIVGRGNDDLLIAILEEAVKKPLPPEGSATRKVIQYYARGMDEANIRHWQLKPLAPFLGAIGALENKEAMARMVGELHTRGIFPGWRFDVNHDRRDSSRYLAELSQGGLGLPDRDYYFLDDERSRQIREAYREHLVKVLTLNGDDAATAARNAATIIAIETELARASMTAVERRDHEKTYNRMTRAKLEEIAPGFAWKQYFAALLAPGLGELGVRQPAFLARFAQLAAERPLEDWKPYLRWHLLQATSDKLDVRYESLHFEFYGKVLTGRAEPGPRSRRVLEVIAGPYGDAPMAEALGQLYVEKRFPAAAKARAEQMVRNIRDALADRLRSVDWMTEETRARALEKVAALRIKVGYPDRWKDLSAANVGDLVFVENWMSANQFAHQRDLARLAGPVDRGEWFISPHIVNAYYSPTNNEIVFPAAILQPPFFDPKADDAVNYGAIGSVIGHEITHGFDSRGRLFDKDGNLRDWWSEEDARRFRERAAKVAAQYGSFSGIDGIRVNGELVLGESISDIGGLRIAYLALQKALKQKPRNPIDGLTPDQRFFISFAQSWRGKLRPDRERMQLRTRQHPPPAFRVRGPIAHMPEFARAFKCDARKVLLPEAERADIW